MKIVLLALALLCVPAWASAAEAAPGPVKQTQIRENWKELFGDALFDLNGQAVPVEKAVSKKYVAIYSSASWCGPCCLFTPKLIRFYEKNKDKMDIILIGRDKTREKVLNYMKGYQMPWPAIFRSERIDDFRKRHKINAVPDLRVFKQNGELLISDAYELEPLQKLLDEEK